MHSFIYEGTIRHRRYLPRPNVFQYRLFFMYLDLAELGKASDFRWAMAATVTGTAAEVTLRERESAMDRYLAKHPHLSDFVHSPTCALCKIRVQTYFVVTRFQRVVEVHVRP